MQTESDQIQSFLDNANKPTLESLSYMLRHPETWPEGFDWDYSRCATCAVGMAIKMWDLKWSEVASATSLMARTFAMPYAEARTIFTEAHRTHAESKLFGLIRAPIRLSKVTPEMVADDIDAYLAKRNAGQ